ncbi:hypothetical protein [Streptomyces sp. NPDC090021]|uniref:hypothetical protein n=1 Tax=Streptomyces sp. NPDC090021 TaxID=3365919 RepID=UPI0037FCE36A
MHRIAKVAVLVAAAITLSAPVANAERSYIYKSYSEEIWEWRSGVQWAGAIACDMDQDGNSVKAHYTRDSGSVDYSHATGGVGTCNEGTLNTTNRVTKHRSQQIRDWATDPYGPWKYRP